MDKVTFKPGCGKVRRKASQDEASVSMEMMSSEFSQSMNAIEQQGK